MAGDQTGVRRQDPRNFAVQIRHATSDTRAISERYSKGGATHET